MPVQTIAPADPTLSVKTIKPRSLDDPDIEAFAKDPVVVGEYLPVGDYWEALSASGLRVEHLYPTRFDVLGPVDNDRQPTMMMFEIEGNPLRLKLAGVEDAFHRAKPYITSDGKRKELWALPYVIRHNRADEETGDDVVVTDGIRMIHLNNHQYREMYAKVFLPESVDV